MRSILRKYPLFAAAIVLAPLALFAQRGPGILWQKPYGGSWLDWGMAFDKTTDGGYILAGHTASDEIPRYHPDLYTLNQRFIDSYIIKIDSLGVIQWEKAYGGDSTDGAIDIIQTNDGGCAVMGETDSPNGDVIGHKGRGDV